MQDIVNDLSLRPVPLTIQSVLIQGLLEKELKAKYYTYQLISVNCDFPTMVSNVLYAGIIQRRPSKQELFQFVKSL